MPALPRYSSLLSALLATALLAACAPQNAAPSTESTPRPGSAGESAARPPQSEAVDPTLVGTRWQLAQIVAADGRALRPGDPGLYTLAFLEEGRVALRVDCNQAGGPWESRPASDGGGSIAIGPLITTLAACAPGSLAGEVIPAIESVDTYTYRQGELRLAAAGPGPSFLFVPAP